MNPDEFIIFFRDSINEARQLQEIKQNILSHMEQIQLEIRLTKMEYLLVKLETERAAYD